jgi:hypothetical protein
VNREMLEWGLRAVIPHVGLHSQNADSVGLEFRNGDLWAFAASAYSMGAARIPDGPDIRTWLPVKEASEMMRFVRPGRVAERTQDLVYAVRPDELHIGWDDLPDSRGDIEADSAVFETTTAPTSSSSLAAVFERVETLYDQPEEWEELILNPALLDKFSKAQLGEFDRLHIHPRRLDHRHGAAVVTVGTDFIGVIAGMTYEGAGSVIVADLLGRERHAA